MANSTGYRSEANRFSNKKNYKQYNLSRYPNDLDTRKNNTNMRGFVNIGETAAVPDYVMAEYMNAAMDGIMSVERTLGTSPMVYDGASSEQIHDLIENFTVSDRISRIESGLFDIRYGGEGWEFVPDRPVLNNHRHDGKDGHPQKIRLTEDVEGLLPYRNINLNYSTGLTGAHISLSPSNSAKLHTVIEDLLSKTQGGSVSGDVSFTGVVKTRTSIDATASDINNKGQSSLVSDNEATSGRSLTSKRTRNQVRMFVIEPIEKQHLLYGRYVLGVQIKRKEGSENSRNLLEFSLGSTKTFISTSDVPTNYRTVHFVFEHNKETKENPLILNKLATSPDEEVIVDSYYIVPIHPATLDI